MEILLCTVFGVFILLSFVIGVRIGQKVSNDEPIRLNPVRAIDEYKEEKEVKRQIKEAESKLTVMFDNIDTYDGTGLGQKDIPR